MIQNNAYEFLQPWFSLSDEERAGLEAELLMEMRPDHVLASVQCKAIGRRCDCADVLFATDKSDTPFAIVHLTWSGKPDQHAKCPSTMFYDSWDSFCRDEMLPEHASWS